MMTLVFFDARPSMCSRNDLTDCSTAALACLPSFSLRKTVAGILLCRLAELWTDDCKLHSVENPGKSENRCGCLLPLAAIPWRHLSIHPATPSMVSGVPMMPTLICFGAEGSLKSSGP